MPAVSKAQQRLFGLAHAIQKGEVPASAAHGAAGEIAKNVSPKDVTDFAATKRKGLPQHHHKKSSFELFICSRFYEGAI